MFDFFLGAAAVLLGFALGVGLPRASSWLRRRRRRNLVAAAIVESALSGDCECYVCSELRRFKTGDGDGVA